MKNVLVFVVLLLPAALLAKPQATYPIKGWYENFPEHQPAWKSRFFYEYTDAESYYYQGGSKRDIRPSGQHGLWIAKRGVRPNKKPLRLVIKSSIGLEARYFAIGINNHLARLTVKFLDKRGRVFAISCIPKTGYYHYTKVAVRLKRGLSAIIFDGHRGQVAGNVNINHIFVGFATHAKPRAVIIHEKSKKLCVDRAGSVFGKSRPGQYHVW